MNVLTPETIQSPKHMQDQPILPGNQTVKLENVFMVTSADKG